MMARITARSAALQLLDALVEPRLVFARIRSGTSMWVAPAAFAAVASMILAGVYFELYLQRTSAETPPPGAVLALFVSLPMSGLGAVLRILGVAYVLWVGSILSDLGVSFKELLELTSIAQMISVLHGVVNVLMFKFVGAPLNATHEVGLNLLTAVPSLQYYLSPINVFSLWYLCFIAFGLRFLSQKTIATSLVAMLPYFVCYAGSYVAFGLLSRGRLW